MHNSYGKNVTMTVFGESHGPCIGAVLDGLPGGVRIDESYISEVMEKRKAQGSISTARKEGDAVRFVSGVKNGYSEGSPLTLLIENANVHSKDYADLLHTPRPSHADYAAHIKYDGYEDPSGGGHFSGRLTAPIVACGAIAMHMLSTKSIYIGTHILDLHGIRDRDFMEKELEKDIALLNTKHFPTLDEEAEHRMIQAIEEARMEQNSLGGILDTAVIGLEAGVGEPMFDSIESVLSHGLFSIPAVKGVEFGLGFDFAHSTGAECNDAFRIEQNRVVTKTNFNGGINGGISNGMPLRFRTVIKPTPSISRKQESVDYVTMENKELEIHGRHDPAIIHRARIVVDSITALCLVDFLMERHGREYFAGEGK